MKFLIENVDICWGEKWKKGFKKCYSDMFEQFKDKITEDDKHYYIEINTLEELMKLSNLTDTLIIEEDSITIYDDYIE